MHQKILVVLVVCIFASSAQAVFVTIKEAIAGLLEPRDGPPAAIDAIVTRFSSEDVVDALLAHLDNDDRFERGTRAASMAIRALASTRDASGNLWIADERQVAVLAESLGWADTGARLEVLQAMRRFDPALLPTMAEPVSRLLQGDDALLAQQALNTMFEVSLPVSHTTRERIKALALRGDPADPLWKAAEELSGIGVPAHLHEAAVRQYLLTTDEPAVAWGNVASITGAYAASAFKAALTATFVVAGRGDISNHDIEQVVFDCLIGLAKERSTQRSIECCTVQLLAAGLYSDSIVDRAAFARGTARLVAEVDAFPVDGKRRIVEALKLNGYEALAAPLESDR